MTDRPNIPKPSWASGVDKSIHEPHQAVITELLDIANAVTALQDRLATERLHNWQLRLKVSQYERMTGIGSAQMPHESTPDSELKKLLVKHMEEKR